MTIEGGGDIASALIDKENVTFFARGVSNSQETDEFEYQREKNLLMQQPKDKRLVYFGSLSIFYNDNRYTQHKLEMEQLVKDNFPKYCIVRLGNITWGRNPHTLINYFKHQVEMEEPVQIRDEYRYIVDQEEFLHWIGMIPDGFSCEVNIPGKRMKVKDVFDKYV